MIAWTEKLVTYYGIDILFFVLFILILHATFSFWRLNIPVYTLIVLSFAGHLMGIFGWYNVSPLPLAWDHITHGFPLFTFTMVLYNFARQWMDRFWSTKTWSLLLLVFLSGLGIGAIVENIEFAGFLALGYGEGGLFLGGPGDGLPLTSAQADAIQEFGGGYLNTELDLLWNALGTLAAMVVMSVIHFRIRKRAP
jgi:uncharacterized membrane protein YjdF